MWHIALAMAPPKSESDLVVEWSDTSFIINSPRPDRTWDSTREKSSYWPGRELTSTDLDSQDGYRKFLPIKFTLKLRKTL